MADKGLLSFIKHKLDHDVDEQSIKHTLMRAGFPERKVDEALVQIKKMDKEAHRKLVVENNFLPPLNKKVANSGKDNKENAANKVIESIERAPEIDLKAHKGLFHGRLRRRDFVLGFLFFFGLGYVALVLAGVFVSQLFPELWSSILEAEASDDSGLLFMLVPVLLFPVTIMLLSLMVRRFHNLEITGGLSLTFLVLFISPVGEAASGILILHAAVAVLFLILLFKKGDPLPNRYGALPSIKGPFFRRIFNV